jgi:hypothetical protein
MTGAVAYPKNDAKAAVIIGVGVPGVGSALVGLGIFMFSVTFGIALDIHMGIIGALCVLDKDLNDEALGKIKTQLAKEFGMEDNLISVVQDYLKMNAASAITNSDGSKSIVLTATQVEDVMTKAADAGITGTKAESLKTLLTHVPTEAEISKIQAELQKASN